LLLSLSVIASLSVVVFVSPSHFCRLGIIAAAAAVVVIMFG
jgi:hypothetical protein